MLAPKMYPKHGGTRNYPQDSEALVETRVNRERTLKSAMFHHFSDSVQ